MSPCYLSGRFEWGDGGIAGEAIVQDLNVPVRQWIVPRRGLDRSCCTTIARLAHFSKGKSIGPLSSAVPTIYARMVRLVPFQLYPPNITMTHRHLDRPSQNLVICPNKLERH